MRKLIKKYRKKKKKYSEREIRSLCSRATFKYRKLKNKKIVLFRTNDHEWIEIHGNHMNASHFDGIRCTHHDHQQVMFSGIIEIRPVKFENHVRNIEALDEKEKKKIQINRLNTQTDRNYRGEYTLSLTSFPYQQKIYICVNIQLLYIANCIILSNVICVPINI